MSRGESQQYGFGCQQGVEAALLGGDKQQRSSIRLSTVGSGIRRPEVGRDSQGQFLAHRHSAGETAASALKLSENFRPSAGDERWKTL